MAGYENATSDKSRYLPMNSSIRRGNTTKWAAQYEDMKMSMYKYTAFPQGSLMVEPPLANKNTR